MKLQVAIVLNIPYTSVSGPKRQCTNARRVDRLTAFGAVALALHLIYKHHCHMETRIIQQSHSSLLNSFDIVCTSLSFILLHLEHHSHNRCFESFAKDIQHASTRSNKRLSTVLPRFYTPRPPSTQVPPSKRQHVITMLPDMQTSRPHRLYFRIDAATCRGVCHCAHIQRRCSASHNILHCVEQPLKRHHRRG
jgi:hypothetical protein